MKILISNDGPHAHYYIRMSWLKVFSAMGHEVQIWEKGQRPAFDVFDEFEPDIFMGQTYNLNEATFKCIKQRPHMKVVCSARVALMFWAGCRQISLCIFCYY